MKKFVIHDDATRGAAEQWLRTCSLQTGASAGLREKTAAVREILDAVRTRGDAAVAAYTERFDGVALTPDRFEVTPAELDAALASIDPELRGILERAHANIAHFHGRNLRESWEEQAEDGTVIGQRVWPIERAGVYVPGGKAFYPSSVLMNIVPAKVAGVDEIVMVSPPSRDGDVHPVVLAAARIAGATRVFRIGGAQAIAALAYGTETIPAVLKITGPGNLYVTLAKAQVRGEVEIDSEAGPSEVAVLADAQADPNHVAAELLAQAEHDEEAMCVLLTPSAELAGAVEARVAAEAAQLPKRAIIEQALAAQGAIIITRDLDEAIALTDLVAPEHLSVQTTDPQAVAARIRHAGAMMLGAYTPVAVGDYYAGPNHILPTGRRARFASPLTAEDFRKVSSVILYSEARLRAAADDIMTFAAAEELDAHARSIAVRL